MRIPIRVLLGSPGTCGDMVSWGAAHCRLPAFLVLLFASVIRARADPSSQHTLIKGKQRGPHHAQTDFWQGQSGCGGGRKRDVGLKPLLSVPWGRWKEKVSHWMKHLHPWLAKAHASALCPSVLHQGCAHRWINTQALQLPGGAGD